jgi:hypothetical protein
VLPRISSKILVKSKKKAGHLCESAGFLFLSWRGHFLPEAIYRNR